MGLRLLSLAGILLAAQAEPDLQNLEKKQRALKVKLPAVEETLPENVAATDGARFTFQRRVWNSPAGTPRGTLFITDLQPRIQGEIEWSVARIRDNRDLTVERCDVHSPGLTYVAVLPPLPCSVTLKGLRRWYCDVPIEFKDPVDGAGRSVGPFTLTVQWPHIVVRAEAPMAQRVLAKVLAGGEIRCDLKKGVERKPHERELLSVSPRSAAAPEGPAAWCGCPNRPTRSGRSPAPQSQEERFRAVYYCEHPLDDIARIVLTFHKPVEEPFEVTSPPLIAER